jgi:hypothetical protein
MKQWANYKRISLQRKTFKTKKSKNTKRQTHMEAQMTYSLSDLTRSIIASKDTLTEAWARISRRGSAAFRESVDVDGVTNIDVPVAVDVVVDVNDFAVVVVVAIFGVISAFVADTTGIIFTCVSKTFSPSDELFR